MDVGFYVSELLELHDRVSVPGLGQLARVRKSGYYNEAEQAFYPPGYELQFQPGIANEDNALINYIADKKNISFESAKYFIEKYINNLQQEALTNEVPMGGIGVFYTQDGQLSFRPAGTLTTDKAFYGLPSIKINKINPEPVAEPVSVTDTAPLPEVREPESNEAIIEEGGEVYEEEVQSRKGLRNALIALGLIVVLALAIFGLKRYNPAAFDKLLAREAKPVASPKPQPVGVDTTKADSAKTDSTKVDTLTAKNKSINNRTIIPAVTNTFAPGSTRIEIIIEAHKNLKTANTVVERYKAKGVNAYIVPDAPGKRIMISAGAYGNRDSAKVAMNALIAAKKIYKDSYPLEIKQK
jgi:hypothetical protein